MITDKKPADAFHGITMKGTGFLLLLFIPLSILHYSLIELNIVKHGAEGATRFIMAEELLFRIGIVLDLVLFITLLILAHSFYRLLRQENQVLALLGLVWILIEVVLSIGIELSSFAALFLVNHFPIPSNELFPLLELVLSLRAEGYLVAVLFFNLGFLSFTWLLFKSPYFPRILAGWGILSFALMLLAGVLKIILPGLPDSVIQFPSVSVMLFQIVTGIWLLIRGTKMPNPTAKAHSQSKS